MRFCRFRTVVGTESAISLQFSISMNLISLVREDAVYWIVRYSRDLNVVAAYER